MYRELLWKHLVGGPVLCVVAVRWPGGEGFRIWDRRLHLSGEHAGRFLDILDEKLRADGAEYMYASTVAIGREISDDEVLACADASWSRRRVKAAE